MEIKFLKDFRGKETKEVFYPAGSVVGVRDNDAARLIELGFAEAFETAMPVKVEHEAEIFSPEAGVVVEDAPEQAPEVQALPEAPEVVVKVEKPKPATKSKVKK